MRIATTHTGGVLIDLQDLTPEAPWWDQGFWRSSFANLGLRDFSEVEEELWLGEQARTAELSGNN